MAFGARNEQEVREIVKPRTDKRDYRRIVLHNALEVLLISYPETDKCAASMNVGVGSFSDPEGLEGLAHFLGLCSYYCLSCTIFGEERKFPEIEENHKEILKGGEKDLAFQMALEKEDSEDGNNSDSSSYSNDNEDERPESKSITTSWPQSYWWQSIDLYSSVPSPSLNFLGTPTLSRLGSSFISYSLTRRYTPEVLPSSQKPLLPPVADARQPPERRSSHSLLPSIQGRPS